MVLLRISHFLAILSVEQTIFRMRECFEKLLLDTWLWQCSACENIHDRDLNTSKNLLNLHTGSSPGINACGDTSCGASQKLASYVSLKQEVMNGIFVHKL